MKSKLWKESARNTIRKYITPSTILFTTGQLQYEKPHIPLVFLSYVGASVVENNSFYDFTVSDIFLLRKCKRKSRSSGIPSVFSNISKRLWGWNTSRRGWSKGDRYTGRHHGNHLRKSTGTTRGWASRGRLINARATGLSWPCRYHSARRGRKVQGSVSRRRTSRRWLFCVTQYCGCLLSRKSI